MFGVIKRCSIVSFLFLLFTADGLGPRQSEYPWRRRFTGPSYWVSYVAKIKVDTLLSLKCTNLTHQKKGDTGEGNGAKCSITTFTLLEIISMQRVTHGRNKTFWFKSPDLFL